MSKLNLLAVLILLLHSCKEQPVAQNNTAKEQTTTKLAQSTPIHNKEEDQKFLSFECEPSEVKMFWKDENGHIFRSFDSLDQWLQSAHQVQLVFAMNGGIFMTNNSPLGLYVEKGKVHRKMNFANGYGNFYMKPNGAFYIDVKGKAGIAIKENTPKTNLKYATQSGPLLVIDGTINSTFNADSKNFNVRNGVSILPNGKCLFVMSKELVNFYEFASFFQSHSCKQALYLDGAISNTYLPEQGFNNKHGDFGIIIAVTKPKEK